MPFKQIKFPSDKPDYQGYSLRQVQDCFGTPGLHFTAWEAWQATEFKHGPAEELPNAYVPVWFWTSAQGIMPLGHVLIWDPTIKKLFGTPRQGCGIETYDLGQVVNDFTRYVGWSEDINGQRVVVEVPA